ncbi:MAG: hydroxyethylthiazole kinase [Thermoprotei archaeon]
MGSPSAQNLDFCPELGVVHARRAHIHEIVNQVVVNDLADVTLSFGRSPIISYLEDELEEIVVAPSAVYLKIASPERDRVRVMSGVARLDERFGVPFAFDPVGAGSTRLRTQLALELLHPLCGAIVEVDVGKCACSWVVGAA